MTSPIAEQVAPTTTRHKTSRLLSRLRCGLQTRLLCTAGLSCRPSSSSESTSDLPRRRADSQLSASVSTDRKRLRSYDRKLSSDDVITSADSGVGRSLETLPDSTSHPTSGCLVSGPIYNSPTYDVIGRRRKQPRSRRLPTVDESDALEPDAVTWSKDHVTEDDVIESPMTTRRRRKLPALRGSSCCNQFYGACDLSCDCYMCVLYVTFITLLYSISATLAPSPNMLTYLFASLLCENIYSPYSDRYKIERKTLYYQYGCRFRLIC